MTRRCGARIYRLILVLGSLGPCWRPFPRFRFIMTFPPATIKYRVKADYASEARRLCQKRGSEYDEVHK